MQKMGCVLLFAWTVGRDPPEVPLLGPRFPDFQSRAQSTAHTLPGCLREKPLLPRSALSLSVGWWGLAGPLPGCVSRCTA